MRITADKQAHKAKDAVGTYFVATLPMVERSIAMSSSSPSQGHKFSADRFYRVTSRRNRRQTDGMTDK